MRQLKDFLGFSVEKDREIPSLLERREWSERRPWKTGTIGREKTLIGYLFSLHCPDSLTIATLET